jgi:hypothetical protein
MRKRKAARGKKRRMARVKAAVANATAAAVARPTALATAAVPAGPTPSWQNARTDLDLARRQLAQALPAIERASAQLAALRESSATVARMEVARQLVGGPSGGALSQLACLAAGRADGVEGASRVAALVLMDLCSALGIRRVHDVGAMVQLDAVQLADVDLLGTAPTGASASGEYTVLKAGWQVGEKWLARPVVAQVVRREEP